MSIGEYKKEFIALYKKMQKEHGEVESVRIVQASKMTEGGIYIWGVILNVKSNFNRSDIMKGLSVVKQMVADGQISQEVAEKYFPELKESENERMLRALREGFDILDKDDEWYSGITNGQILVWLEKQGETFTKKDVDDAYLKGICDAKHELEKQDKEKSVPNWMPKFLDELRSKKNYFDWDEHRDIEGGILAIIKWMKPNYFNGKDGAQKPAEWSEEDEAKIVKLKSFIAQCKGFNKENRNKAFDLIDSIKLRYAWKPSKEQMEAMQVFLEHGCAAPDREASLVEKVFESLYNDLKNL